MGWWRARALSAASGRECTGRTQAPLVGSRLFARRDCRATSRWRHRIRFLSAALRQRENYADRRFRGYLEGEGLAARAGGNADDPDAGYGRRSRPGDRAARGSTLLQSLVHDRRIQAARQHEPSPEGGLSGKLGAPPGLPVLRGAAAAQRHRRADRQDRIRSAQSFCSLASPAVVAPCPAQSVDFSQCPARRESDRPPAACGPAQALSRAGADPRSGANRAHP